MKARPFQRWQKYFFAARNDLAFIASDVQFANSPLKKPASGDVPFVQVTKTTLVLGKGLPDYPLVEHTKTGKIPTPDYHKTFVKIKWR
jgi:hypothetical protein